MSPALPLFVSSIFSRCLIIQFISLRTCLSNLSHMESYMILFCRSSESRRPSLRPRPPTNKYFYLISQGGTRTPPPYPPTPPEVTVRAMRQKNGLRNWGRLFDIEEIELSGERLGGWRGGGGFVGGGRLQIGRGAKIICLRGLGGEHRRGERGR